MTLIERTSSFSADAFSPACRACFLTHVHFAWQALAFRDILRSGTSVCVAVAGHRTLCSFVASVIFGFGRCFERLESLSFCETDVVFVLVHGHHFGQAQNFRCLRLIFVAGAVLQRRGKRAPRPRLNMVKLHVRDARTAW